MTIVLDHGYSNHYTSEVEKLAISEFKARCLSLVEQVRRTGQPLLITKRGVPVAQVVPAPPPEPSEESAFGCMKSAGKELGDLTEQLEVSDWEVLR